MATEEDVKDKTDDGAADDDGEEPASDPKSVRTLDAGASVSDEAPEKSEPASERSAEPESEEVLAPTQLGTTRFVYAAYFAGAIGVAFLVSKVVTVAWQRLAMVKPALGEPHDEIVMPIAAALGGLTALYYWKRTRARKLAEEVAEELAQVTWPNKEEVTNSTAVVIVTTMLATIFFALMDRFWGFVTNLVYGT